MRRSPLVVTVVGSLALAALAGCAARLEGKATQPNPLAVPPAEQTYGSKHIHIRIKDMEVPRTFRMYNTAWFNVVSRDRLRFHVSLVHKWEEMTDVRNYHVRLEDDRGNVYYPELTEKSRNKFTTKMWDYERRSAIHNLFGDTIGTRNDGYRQRTTLDAVDLFKGDGDVTFHAKDIIDPKTKRLTLVLSRGGIEYRFTWRLYDPRVEQAKDDGPYEDPDAADSDDGSGVLSPYDGPSGARPEGTPGPVR
jgi:hypothetical protein